MSDKRNKIIEKVRALFAKTTENGCTENEALAAAALAAKLMEEYDLAYSDVEKELQEDTYGKRGRKVAGGSYRRRSWHESIECAVAIAEFWDCRVWKSGSDLIYFGTKSDTELAHNTLAMIQTAMDAEWGKHFNETGRTAVHGRRRRTSFMLGMAYRLNVRLRELKAERSGKNIQSTTGTALVVLKNQVVTEKYAAYLRSNNIRIKASANQRTSCDHNSFQAGQAAANNVDLGGGKIDGGYKRLQ